MAHDRLNRAVTGSDTDYAVSNKRHAAGNLKITPSYVWASGLLSDESMIINGNSSTPMRSGHVGSLNPHV